MAAKKKPAAPAKTTKVAKPAKAAKPAAKPAKKPAISAPLTKTAVLTTLAEETGLTRKQVQSVIEGLEGLVSRALDPKKGVGQFTIPNLVKITSVKKPAQKPRKARNPFTGEEIMTKAKPARQVIKVRALAKLKAMV